MVSHKIRSALVQRSDEFDIVLDDISITHLAFGREFTLAVEMKQVAQQEAERARFVVEKAEQEKIAAITRAEGDTKAAELISEALQQSGNGLIKLRKIEAAKEIAQNMSRSRNVTYLPGGGSENGGTPILMNMNAN